MLSKHNSAFHAITKMTHSAF